MVLWGPPGFGKTLLLKEVARARELPYREEWSEEEAVFDLKRPPPQWQPGRLYAMRRKPEAPAEVLLLGPEALALSEAEAREMARHLGAGRSWRRTWERLGGWPVLLRRAYEAGVSRPHEEPLRSWLKSFLARLTPSEREVLELLRFGPSEQVAHEVLPAAELETILARGLALPQAGRLQLLAALASYLEETLALPPLSRVKPLLAAEREFGDRQIALEGYLNYHAREAAAVFAEAAAVWNREGRAAQTISYWDRLEGAEPGPHAFLAVAEAEYLSGRLERALGLYRRAAELAQKGEAYNEALLGVGTVLVRMGSYREAAEAFREAAKGATPAQRFRADASLGGALIRDGRYEEAATVLKAAGSVTQEAGETAALARARHNLGIAYHHMGRIQEAIAAYQASLALRREAAPLERANTMLSLGEALRLAGRWEEAHRVLSEAREVAASSGEYRALGYSQINLGDLYSDAGWLEEAGVAYQGALDELEPSQDSYGVGLVQLGLGRVYAQSGRPREAWWRLERAEENLREGGSAAELAAVWLAKARLRPEGAAELLERARRAAAGVGARRLALVARLEEMALEPASLRADQVEEAAAELLALDALPLLLDERYAPVWFAAGATGEAGGLVFERLVHGWGTVRFYTLGQERVLRRREVEFFTRKEPWVLYALWLFGPQEADELAERVFPDAKNPRKRVQIAVHHVREALGEDWIRHFGGRYHAAPLPGTWWDAAVLASARRAQPVLPDWAAGAAAEAERSLERGELLPEAPFSTKGGLFS